MASIVAGAILFSIMTAFLVVAVYSSDFGFTRALFDKPSKDQVERVKRVIPYVSEMKYVSPYGRSRSDEEEVALLLQSRKHLLEFETKVQARELLDQYDPVRLQAKIDELEAKLGIGPNEGPNEKPKPNETHSKKKARKRLIWGSGGPYL